MDGKTKTESTCQGSLIKVSNQFQKCSLRKINLITAFEQFCVLQNNFYQRLWNVVISSKIKNNLSYDFRLSKYHRIIIHIL